MFQSLREKLSSFIGNTGKEIKLTKSTRIKGFILSKIKLSESDLEDLLWKLHIDLIQSDVAVETADFIIENIKRKLLDSEVEKDKIDEYIKNSIRDVLFDVLTPERDVNLLEDIKSIERSERPYKIVFLGINGSGKTTTIAKIAYYLIKNNLSVVMAAGDTFRAGAIEQIEKHAKNLGVRVIKHQKGADAAAVIYDAIEHAKAKNIDVVLADTAGRMQTNVNLMDELKKICRVNKPNLKIFVGDSLTGNDAVDQAKRFNDAVGIDAVILTKMDSDAKGGSTLSITNEIKKPVIFIGIGQGYEDLMEFDKEWFINQLL
ncbi:MAG: signal recognition particle-docking protein FtsY [Candidatus Altiarchaeales archaeon]|nr:MAG: signal recognition particle-docking protein FtsY [Candidatus Altiarchaeales archaeon]